MMRRTSPILAALACCLWLLPNAFGQIRNEQHVKAELIVPDGPVQLGQPFEVAVRLKIDPGWHVYWKYPGDAGSPTTVKWTLPAGYTAGELQYPIPQEIDEPGGIAVYAYEGEVVLKAVAKPPKVAPEASDNTNEIKADVSWLVCEKVCIPGKASLVGKASFSPDAAAQIYPAAAPPDDLFQTILIIARPGELTVRLYWANPPANPELIEWFPAVPDGLIPHHPTIKTKENRTTVKLKYEAIAGAVPPKSIESVLAYTDADGIRRAFKLEVRLAPDSDAPTPPPAQR